MLSLGAIFVNVFVSMNNVETKIRQISKKWRKFHAVMLLFLKLNSNQVWKSFIANCSGSGASEYHRVYNFFMILKYPQLTLKDFENMLGFNHLKFIDRNLILIVFYENPFKWGQN